VGWQIDPFGHSALQATLLGPGVGFQAVFLGRAHYLDLQKRIAERTLEFTWKPGQSEEEDDISDDASSSPPFYGLILGSGNYGPPEGFDWDVSRDPPICDDPEMQDEYNAPKVVDAFVNTTLHWAQRFRGAGGGGDVMFTFGSDFNYQAAGMWFTNLGASPGCVLHTQRGAVSLNRQL
jgi:alpha-mannosidase